MTTQTQTRERPAGPAVVVEPAWQPARFSDGRVLGEALERAALFASRDHVRISLQHVSLTVIAGPDDTTALQLVAADGFILIRASLPITPDTDGPPVGTTALLPSTAASDWARVLKKAARQSVTLDWRDIGDRIDRLRIRTADTTQESETTPGDFPTFESVIPTRPEGAVASSPIANPFGFNPALLAKVVKACNIGRTGGPAFERQDKPARCIPAADPHQPILFIGQDRADHEFEIVLMPMFVPEYRAVDDERAAA